VYKIFQNGYGTEKAREIMDHENERSYLSVTVNTLKVSVEELYRSFLDHGADCIIDPKGMNSIIFTDNVSPMELPGFDEGYFFVQDTSSLQALTALSPSEGELVIDTCACPGGKTFAAAIIMKNKGKIFSFDLHKSKLSLIESGAHRLGIDIVEASVCDGKTPREDLFEKADAVICDAPCSGLGVVSKKPEIRYKSLSEINDLPKIQKDILFSSARYVKHGGRLMYSTCTLNPKENEEISNIFLKQNKEFVRADVLGDSGVTIFPKSTLSCDGFYYDIFYRK